MFYDVNKQNQPFLENVRMYVCMYVRMYTTLARF